MGCPDRWDVADLSGDLMTQHRITVDLGPLYSRLQSHCEATGQRPSEVVREAVAKLLRVKPPRMDGQVKNLRQYRKPADGS